MASASLYHLCTLLGRKEGRKFTHPWQPTRRNGWNSVCLSSADILSRPAMMYLLTMGWFLAHTSLATYPVSLVSPLHRCFGEPIEASLDQYHLQLGVLAAAAPAPLSHCHQRMHFVVCPRPSFLPSQTESHIAVASIFVKRGWHDTQDTKGNLPVRPLLQRSLQSSYKGFQCKLRDRLLFSWWFRLARWAVGLTSQPCRHFQLPCMPQFT